MVQEEKAFKNRHSPAYLDDHVRNKAKEFDDEAISLASQGVPMNVVRDRGPQESATVASVEQ